MDIPFILAIDEGTTNAKAIAVDMYGNIIAKGSEPVQLSNPKPGWAEQDPMEIWFATQKALKSCISSLDLNQVKGIAISNQRESVLAWERSTGKPLSSLISWQCRRTEDLCKEIARHPDAQRIKDLTDSILDPLYPASKIKWLLNSIENGIEKAEKGEICVGTVDVWLVWQLTAGQSFFTDYSNASRYQLFNIHSAKWDDELLTIFDIPKACLPEIIPSSGERGVTKNVDFLSDGIPVLSQIGDSHAALYGHCGFDEGVVKATYGTGSSLMTRTNIVPSQDFGVGTTVAWHDGETLSLALEGNITYTGSGLAFMAKLLGISNVDTLSQMAQSVDSNGGVYFVPALAGLGAPYWDLNTRGLICGLTAATTPEILARAAMESVVFQIADLFFAMERTLGKSLNTLSVDGGPTKNQWLMQLQSDVLQRTIVCSEVAEVSALGAAYLAGRALGWWKNNTELLSLNRVVKVIKPNSKPELQTDYQNWIKAVERTRFQTN